MDVLLRTPPLFLPPPLPLIRRWTLNMANTWLTSTTTLLRDPKLVVFVTYSLHVSCSCVTLLFLFLLVSKVSYYWRLTSAQTILQWLIIAGFVWLSLSLSLWRRRFLFHTTLLRPMTKSRLSLLLVQAICPNTPTKRCGPTRNRFNCTSTSVESRLAKVTNSSFSMPRFVSLNIKRYRNGLPIILIMTFNLPSAFWLQHENATKIVISLPLCSTSVILISLHNFLNALKCPRIIPPFHRSRSSTSQIWLITFMQTRLVVSTQHPTDNVFVFPIHFPSNSSSFHFISSFKIK